MSGAGLQGEALDCKVGKPVIIAGAGPCGLTAALALKQAGVPFVVFERATREKLCANAGSGYDIMPTALDILRRLQVPFEGTFNRYAGLFMAKMDEAQATNVRVVRMADFMHAGRPYEAFAANRSEMQELLVSCLGEDGAALHCGVGVRSFEQDDDGVTVELTDGSSVEGAALLGCDGISSAVRKGLHGGGAAAEAGRDRDPLHYCGINCWWGKIDNMDDACGAGALRAALAEAQPFGTDGAALVWLMGSGAKPGMFFVVPGKGGVLMWGFFAHATEPPPRSDDLTRRGGVSLAAAGKRELQELLHDRCALVRLTVDATDAGAITKVGLFDRERLDLPYASGRVALLGDAAHPQTPFMGQGVNMALADAYVVAMRLARQPPAAALQAYDAEARRRGVNKIILRAREYGDYSVSANRLTCWAFATMVRWMPLNWLLGDMISADSSNDQFVRAMHAEFGIGAE